MPESKISVVPIKTKTKPCRPFILEVMVFSPEAGYRFNLQVERQCKSETDSIWKLVFDLEKKIENEYVTVVHVSFTAGTQEEQKGIKSMVTDGVSYEASGVIVDEVHPAVKDIEGEQTPTDAQKKKIKDSMSKTAITQLNSLEL